LTAKVVFLIHDFRLFTKQYTTKLETKFAESLEKLKEIEDKWKKGKAPIEEEVLEIKKEDDDRND